METKKTSPKGSILDPDSPRKVNSSSLGPLRIAAHIPRNIFLDPKSPRRHALEEVKSLWIPYKAFVRNQKRRFAFSEPTVRDMKISSKDFKKAIKARRTPSGDLETPAKDLETPIEDQKPSSEDSDASVEDLETTSEELEAALCKLQFTFGTLQLLGRAYEGRTAWLLFYREDDVGRWCAKCGSFTL
jgi:hypothetical protein